jgi:mRNA-degrading endonuclease RelE of RelBE toxin-antitoxin system
MYRIKVSPRLDEIFKKLDKKNRKQVEIILRKLARLQKIHIDIRTFGHHLIT